MTKMIYSGEITAGLIAGAVLGLFFKFIEVTTKVKVYTLLLNVDYIPFLNTMRLPEAIEFGIHLLISVVLSLILAQFIKRRTRKVAIVIAVTLLIGMALYPTTLLSERTPEFENAGAVLYWLIGHILYGVILGKLLKNVSERGILV